MSQEIYEDVSFLSNISPNSYNSCQKSWNNFSKADSATKRNVFGLIPKTTYEIRRFVSRVTCIRFAKAKLSKLFWDRVGRVGDEIKEMNNFEKDANSLMFSVTLHTSIQNGVLKSLRLILESSVK